MSRLSALLGTLVIVVGLCLTICVQGCAGVPEQNRLSFYETQYNETVKQVLLFEGTNAADEAPEAAWRSLLAAINCGDTAFDKAHSGLIPDTQAIAVVIPILETFTLFVDSGNLTGAPAERINELCRAL